MFFLERAETDPGCAQSQDSYIRCLAPRTVAVENVNAIDEPSLQDAVNAVIALRQRLTADFAVTPERLVVVGSSGLSAASHSSRLAEAIQAALGASPRFSYVTAEEEAREFQIGATTMLPPAQRSDVNARAVFIDIGSGNLKGSFVDTTILRTFDITFGTKTATQAIDTARGTRDFGPAADEWIDQVYRPLVRSEFDRRPGATNRDHIYLAGGAVWALSTLTDPANRDKLPAITAPQIDAYVTRVDRSDAVREMCSENLDVNVNPEIRDVCKIFSISNLRASARILRVLATEMDFQHKHVVFVKDALVAWPLGYLREHTAAFSIPAVPSPVAGSALRLHGSNTIGAELAPALLQGWVQSGGGQIDRWIAPVNDESSATVLGGIATLPGVVEVFSHGSGSGIPDLVAHKADLADLSRPLKPDEVDLMRRNGIPNPRVNSSETVIGLDGVAIFLNPGIRIGPLKPEQIAAIFIGEITDWGQLGGPRGPITVFHRPPNSGTIDVFRYLMDIPASTPLVGSEIESSEVLSDRVSSTAGAIGFAGMAYVHNNDPVRVDECGIQYPPHPFLVKSEEYPLFRRLYMYRRPDDRNPWVEPFIRFVTSTVAQPAIENAGFVSQAIETGNETITALRRDAARNEAANSPSRGPDERRAIEHMLSLTNRQLRVSTTFRFAFDESRIDSVAEDNLIRLRAFMYRPENTGRKLTVIGFASAPGSDSHNLGLSQQRAHNIAQRLRGFGNINVAEEFGVGKNLYVACNDPESHAFRNQRVEIWIDPH